MELITFDIVDIEYLYNAIFGRLTLNKFSEALHQDYLCLKVPRTGGVIAIYGNQEEARKAERNFTCGDHQVHIITLEGQNKPAEEDPRADEAKERVALLWHTKKVLIGSKLYLREEQKLLACLREDEDVFPWSPNDLEGINRDTI